MNQLALELFGSDYDSDQEDEPILAEGSEPLDYEFQTNGPLKTLFQESGSYAKTRTQADLTLELFGSDTETSENEMTFDQDCDITMDEDPEQDDPTFKSILDCSNGQDDNALDGSITPRHEAHPHIPGLVLHTGILTHLDQSRLMEEITRKNFFKGGQQNQAMCFGQKDLQWLSWLEEKLHQSGALSSPYCMNDWTTRVPLFDQSIMNLYRPGDGIKPHVDLARFEDGIIIVSLLSATSMDFYPALHPMTPKDHVDGGANSPAAMHDPVSEQIRSPAYSVRLQPGSVITMEGPARYEWEHGIAERSGDLINGDMVERKIRVSVTLRKMRSHAWEIGPSATANGVADRR